MSRLNRHEVYILVSNIINRLEIEGFLKVIGTRDQVAEMVTKELIQSGVLREFLNLDRLHLTNMHRTLEEVITEGGKVMFIHRMEFDKKQGLFTLDLKFNPESDYIDKTILFQGVQEFKETVDEEEDTTHYLDSIIGLDQYSTKYVLRTEVREIMFSSIIPPEVFLTKRMSEK